MLHKVLLISCLSLGGCLPAAVGQDFRVQVGAYSDSMPQSFFTNRGLERVLVSTNQMGLYRYFVGTYLTREQAETKLQEVMAKGFPNAMIIDLEEQRALGGATCPYNRPNHPIFATEAGPNTALSYLYFDTGSATLSPKSRQELDLVAQALKANPTYTLQIIGQTDGVGSAVANQELATSRARAARDYLINRGIRTDRMTIKVYGEAEAELDNKDPQGNDLPINREKNRRVVLGLVKG